MRKRRRKEQRHSKEFVETASGVAWYDREQWQRLRQVASDPERLEASYEDWLTMAQRAIRDLEATGMIIEKVRVNTEELIAWCNEHGRAIDSSARAEFAAQELRELHRSN